MTFDIDTFADTRKSSLDSVRNSLILMRPMHWSKSIIAVPIGPAFLFSHGTVIDILFLIGTISLFCIASGAVYIINDLCDIEKDRVHPTKSHRPLASGAIRARAAYALLTVLSAIMVLLIFTLPPIIAVIIAIYLFLNLIYSFGLKHVPIVEILIVSTGFAFRTASGYLAFGFLPDPWVLSAVFSGNILLTVGKRREEMQVVSRSGEHRPVLTHYTSALLDSYIQIATVATLTCVLMVLSSIVDTADSWILFVISLPFVIYLFLRYLLVAFAEVGTGNPTRLLLSDKNMHWALILWAIVVGTKYLIVNIGFLESVTALEVAGISL